MSFSETIKTVKDSTLQTLVPTAQTNSGNKAYSLADKEALAQLVCTGTLGNKTLSVETDFQKSVLELSQRVSDEFLGKLAIYAREKAFMKDTPAFLTAILSTRNPSLLKMVFPKTITDPKMLRNFVKIMRSGIVGRKSLGTVSKRLVQDFIANLTDDQLFKANIGNDPSMSDIIKLSHPRPSTPARAALFSYILGKEYKDSDLSPLVQEFETFKKELGDNIPNVPFQMLTALTLKDSHWAQIAEKATWTQMRMNLNTYARHNVFSNEKSLDIIAKKLSSKEDVEKARVMPYQIFSAFKNVEAAVPQRIKNALEVAAGHSLKNVPAIEGKVYVMIDVSGSMGSPVMGSGNTHTSKMTYIDVASVFASAILAKNESAGVIPFDTRVHENGISTSNSIMENAAILGKHGGGGTNCSIALKELNTLGVKGDEIITVIFISDNESNVDPQSQYKTEVMKQWDEFKKNNPNAKLINIDIAIDSKLLNDPFITIIRDNNYKC